MGRQFFACLRANLLFYRRNRLLWLIGAVLAFSFIVTLIPAVYFRGTSVRFELAKMVFEYLNFFFFIFAAVLGLVGVSSHLRDRSIKMVATKPIPLELWLASHFVTAFIIFGSLVLGNLVLTSSLFLAWSIPVQSGILLIAVTTVCGCMILFSFLTFLSVLMHPALAGVLALFLQDSTFYQLSTLTASAEGLTRFGWYKTLLSGVKYVLLMFYKVLPVYSPHANDFGTLSSSLRAETSHLIPMAGAVGYALAFSVLLYLLSVVALRKRRLI